MLRATLKQLRPSFPDQRGLGGVQPRGGQEWNEGSSRVLIRGVVQRSTGFEQSCAQKSLHRGRSGSIDAKSHRRRQWCVQVFL